MSERHLDIKYDLAKYLAELEGRIKTLEQAVFPSKRTRQVTQPDPSIWKDPEAQCEYAGKCTGDPQAADYCPRGPVLTREMVKDALVKHLVGYNLGEKAFRDCPQFGAVADELLKEAK